jgi:hypothetical protein
MLNNHSSYNFFLKKVSRKISLVVYFEERKFRIIFKNVERKESLFINILMFIKKLSCYLDSRMFVRKSNSNILSRRGSLFYNFSKLEKKFRLILNS